MKTLSFREIKLLFVKQLSTPHDLLVIILIQITVVCVS